MPGSNGHSKALELRGGTGPNRPEAAVPVSRDLGGGEELEYQMLKGQAQLKWE